MLDEVLSISKHQIDEFQRNGATLVRSLLPGDVSSFREIISQTTFQHNKEDRALADRDTYGKAFLQTMNLWLLNDQVRAFVLSKRFASVAAQLLGVEQVRLYHDQSLFKESGGGITPWHQDQFYWPLDTNKTITMWMPLVDTTSDMGLMQFALGSQEAQISSKEAISEDSEELYKQLVDKQGFTCWQPEYMAAGDATFHYGHTVHRAGANVSDTTREVMTIIYFADGARVTTPENTFQENDRNTWLAGYAPGRIANSELNPVLL